MLFAVSLKKRTRSASVACLICSMEYRLILETISTFAVSKTVSYLLSGLVADYSIYLYITHQISGVLTVNSNAEYQAARSLICGLVKL